MVRGSDSESGDKEPKKYNGSVGRWKASRIKLKSKLYGKGLWDVVEKGPVKQNTLPETVGAGGRRRMRLRSQLILVAEVALVELRGRVVRHLDGPS